MSSGLWREEVAVYRQAETDGCWVSLVRVLGAGGVAHTGSCPMCRKTEITPRNCASGSAIWQTGKFDGRCLHGGTIYRMMMTSSPWRHRRSEELLYRFSQSSRLVKLFHVTTTWPGCECQDIDLEDHVYPRSRALAPIRGVLSVMLLSQPSEILIYEIILWCVCLP